MAWSEAFRAEMLRGSPRRHRIRTVALRAGNQLALGDDWCIEAKRGGHGVAIADEGWTSVGGELAVGSFTSTLGQWSVPLIGNGHSLMRRLRRGQMVVHEVGFPGWGESRWEPVQLGQVYAYNGHPGRWSLTMRDVLSTMRSRPSLDAGAWPLFYSIGTSTTLAARYAAGDTTLTVTAFSGLDRPTGGTGMVVIDPDSDSPFYLTYTGTATTPNRLTGVSASGQLGTTARTAVNGATVKDVAYLEDDPLSIAAKVITSTGNATNGVYDVLPNSWGFALPHQYLDTADIDYFRPRIAPSSGVDDWILKVDEPQTDGIAFLSQYLNRAGLFLGQRQGQITARAVVNWQGATETAQGSPLSFGRLLGAHIVPDSIQWGAWDGGVEDPFYRLKVYSASGNTADTYVETPTGLPARETWEDAELSDALWSNQTAQRNATAARLRAYILRMCERFECDIMHPLACSLTPGDMVPLHVRYFGGRSEWQTGAYDGRPGLVIRVDPDFAYGRATHVVMAVPVAQGAA